MDKLINSSKQFRQLLSVCFRLLKARQLPQSVLFERFMVPAPAVMFAKDEKPKGFEKFWDKGRASETKSEDKPKKEEDNKDKKEEEGKTEDESDKGKEKKTKATDEWDYMRMMPSGPRFPLWALMLIGWMLYTVYQAKSTHVISKQDLLDMLKAKSISKMESYRSSLGETIIRVFNKNQILVGVHKTYDADSLNKDIEKAQKDAGIQPADILKPETSKSPESNWLYAALIVGLGILLIRGASQLRNFGNMSNFGKNGSNLGKPPPDKKRTGGGLGGPRDIFDNIFGFGSSKAIEYSDVNKVEVSFRDVAGMEGPKEEIQEFVEFLKNPQKFRKLGAKIPKGALLAGPPGTGKTLLAKACAGEAGVPFFATSGSEFVEMFVGVGAARVRDLFRKAKSKSPAIIFIDEIDAIGKHRAKIGYNDERESTLNQIFVELDGFGTDTNVVVFAATNRKDALDKALIRPGRFDRLIEINLPTLKEREQIFGVHLKGITVSTKVPKAEIAKKLSALTMGMSGADIASICNESAILAARRNKKAIDLDDFYEAYDRVLTGLKRRLPLSEYDKKVTAFHEAGHAIVGWFLKNAQPVLKVSPIFLTHS